MNMVKPLKSIHWKVGTRVSWLYGGQMYTSTIKVIKNGRAHMDLDEWNIPLTDLLEPIN